MNKADIYICVQVLCEHKSSIVWDKGPIFWDKGMQLLAHTVVAFFLISKLFSRIPVPFYITANIV